MKTRALALSAALVLALPLTAASRNDDALSLVPADAASVGMVRLADLRTSPLSSRIFAETDHMTCDGDAARFLEEARLNWKEDVDAVTFSFSPSASGHGGSALVAFEGRFDPARLSAALASRGAVKKTTASGEYFLLPDHNHAEGKDDGVVSFLSTHLVIAGSEDAVVKALAQRQSGGTAFRSGNGLGQKLSRIESGATAWALVDLSRYPQMQKAADHVKVDGDVNGTPVPALMGAMKSVSFVAFQATVKGDALKLGATGLSDNEETRELLADTLKGALAAWRLAAQEKSPDTVAVLRKFKVETDRESVSVSGTLPGAAIRAITEKKEKHEAATTK
ncbi:MAG TPA: hypothetical protein VGR00_01245 [Thermoanaerobaculia bacterium]|jgi:hypothetical protein|nr:hypothetical protein [Thermoanaerobaculia bacterium]